jgi:hypothetical protein
LRLGKIGVCEKQRKRILYIDKLQHVVYNLCSKQVVEYKPLQSVRYAAHPVQRRASLSRFNGESSHTFDLLPLPDEAISTELARTVE